MSTPASRRGLLALASALAVVAPVAAAPVVAAAPHADAVLLDLCRRFHAQHEHLDELARDDDSLEEGRPWDLANDVWWELAETIFASPARTLEGIQAKAGIFLPFMRNVVGEPPFNDGDERLAWSIVQDVLALSAPAVAS